MPWSRSRQAQGWQIDRRLLFASAVSRFLGELQPVQRVKIWLSGWRNHGWFFFILSFLSESLSRTPTKKKRKQIWHKFISYGIRNIFVGGKHLRLEFQKKTQRPHNRDQWPPFPPWRIRFLSTFKRPYHFFDCGAVKNPWFLTVPQKNRRKVLNFKVWTSKMKHVEDPKPTDLSDESWVWSLGSKQTFERLS